MLAAALAIAVAGCGQGAGAPSQPAPTATTTLATLGSLTGGVVEAFGSLWVTNFGVGTTERYELPSNT